MSTRSKKQESQKAHDRSAVMQWAAVGLLVVLGLIAALVLTDGGRGGGHTGAPAISVDI